MQLFIYHWLLAAVSVASTAAALSPPGCELASAPPQSVLNVTSGNLTVPGDPFGLVYASDHVAFAALDSGQVAVLNTSTFTPTIIREIALPTTFYSRGTSVGALTITSDKRNVYVSLGTGAAVLDVKSAVASTANPFVGFLNGTAGNSSIQTTLSHDDKYAFVSQEYGNAATGSRGTIESFSVRRAANGSVSSTYIGYVALEYAVVGTALTHDGSKLIALSESHVFNNISTGVISILDVAALKTNPGQALLNSVNTSCSPVRVEVSADGKYAWINARESNKLLAYDVAKLVSSNKSSDALVASVEVGTSPVGLRLVNGGRQIVTADSNRYNYGNTTGLTVEDVEAVLKGSKSGGFPRIKTGLFPRELVHSPDGKTLLVSQYSSSAIQSVNLTQLAASCA